jgi:hypothetical protein
MLTRGKQPSGSAMPLSFAALRDRLPALVITALCHVALIALLVVSLPKRFESQAPVESETRITFFPAPPAPPVVEKKRVRRAEAGSNAITTYFDPNTYRPPSALTPNIGGVSMALAACLPEKYDMASDEIRIACNRIGALLRSDRGHFSVTQDVIDPSHWQRELARRNAPFLAPCMSPGGVNVLYTLYCIYDLILHPYDPEKQLRYSE